MNIINQRDALLQQERIKDWERQMAAQARTMPLTESEQYGSDLSRIYGQRQAVQKNAPWAGYDRPTQEAIAARFPIPENPISTQIKADLGRNPFGALPQPEWPVQPPLGLITTPTPETQWPIPVPDELIRTGGAGGGMRDSNIQDTTGLTGGGGLLMGGAGGGMRDSNIQDATGTTGGNAGANVASKGFDWDGLSSGLGQLGKGMKSTKNNDEIRAPAMGDDSGQRMAAASQLWQAVMNKRKPKGLI